MINQIPALKDPGTDPNVLVVGAMKVTEWNPTDTHSLTIATEMVSRLSAGTYLFRCVINNPDNAIQAVTDLKYQLWVRLDLIDLVTLIDSNGAVVQLKPVTNIREREPQQITGTARPDALNKGVRSRATGIPEDADPSLLNAVFDQPFPVGSEIPQPR